ncbi:hypothetical protein BC940DRAFT_305178 [Gongronella butleri]|nr:hypothetical protein BC940DRAFT_305178 [Gongronella butleri]
MPESVPQPERDTLHKLSSLRNRLSAFKRDRTRALDPEKLEEFRHETVAITKELADLRQGVLLSDQRAPNRCDDLLDEVCQMISLCYLSLGKTRESPAVYAQVNSILHCFERLEEFGIYAQEFLEPYEKMLNDIKMILEIDERHQSLSPYIMQILWYKFHQCESIYSKLQATIHQVSPELLPIRDQLLRIRRQLLTVACQSEFDGDDLKPLQEELDSIDSKRTDGKFCSSDGSVPAGQAVVIDLLSQVYGFAYDLIIATTPDYSPYLQGIRDRLVEIKCQLERLQLTQKWTMRQTDLYSYQHQLHDIVKLRYSGPEDEGDGKHACAEIDTEKLGKFVDEQGNVPQGQTCINFLLHKCYRMILMLLIDSVPVSEALTPVYNQLTSVRQCLRAVKNTGAPCSDDELYPYQMKLASIEQMRKNGNFYDGDHIPEGQALCVSVLEECYQLLDDLRDNATPSTSTSNGTANTDVV